MVPVIDSIHAAFGVLTQVRKESVGSPRYGFDDSFDVFIMKMLCLTPQSYGCRLQSFLIERFCLARVSQQKGTGDFQDQFGECWELKASIITDTNAFLNLVQIRPWQSIAGYLCVAIDTRSVPFTVDVYRLSKSDMESELTACRATAAHGTKDANTHNQKVELRLSIPIAAGNKDYDRWAKYRTNIPFRR